MRMKDRKVGTIEDRWIKKKKEKKKKEIDR